MPQNIPADTRNNLPAGQQYTQRLVDQFNADEQNWRERNALGRRRKNAMFPVAPTRAGLPSGYAGILRDLKQRIQQERLRTVMAANAGMVLLYWDIGRTILQRQATEGWGAKVIDRLSADLRQAFPDMKGLSPRNLKYMRAFAEAWPDRGIMQRIIAQLPWRQNVAYLEQLKKPEKLYLTCSGGVIRFLQQTHQASVHRDMLKFGGFLLFRRRWAA